jgi:DNA-binding beta-propeller fold protein YncE
MRLLFAWFLSAWFLTGCSVAARSGPPPKLYKGTTLASDQVAILDWGCASCGGSVKEVDGKKVEDVTRRDTRVAVLPGEHRLRYEGWYGGSVMLGPASRTVTQTDVIELKAGHEYLVKATRRGPWSHPSLYLWIDDAATGEAVAGNVYRDLPAGSLHLAGPPRGPGVSAGGFVGLGVGEGSVWVLTTNSLVRLDTRLKRVDATIPITGTGLWAGAGAVWVRQEDRVLRIDPTTSRVVATIALPGGGGIEVMDGAVWVLDKGTFSRIDPGTNKISATYRVDPSGSLDVGEGSIWVAKANGILSRIDLISQQETATIPIGIHGTREMREGGRRPWMRVAVSDGSVFVQNLKELSFIRVDSKTNRVTTTTPVGNLLAVRGAVAQPWWAFSKPRSAESAVWALHDDRISAIDSRGGHVRATLLVPADWRRFVDMLVAEGAIWIVSAEGERTAFIRRIELPEKQ